MQRRLADLLLLVLVLLGATLFIGAASCGYKPPPQPPPITPPPTTQPSPTVPPAPSPGPTPSTCTPPYSGDWACVPDCAHVNPASTDFQACTSDSYYSVDYNMALFSVVAAHPEWFDQMKPPHVVPNDEATRAKVFDALAADLRARGFCAGWRVDQLDVADVRRLPTRFEGFHAINFGGGALIQAQQAYRGYCSPVSAVPPPQPPPSPGPTPTPVPPPPDPSACQPMGLKKFDLKIVVQANVTVQATPRTTPFFAEGDPRKWPCEDASVGVDPSDGLHSPRWFFARVPQPSPADFRLCAFPQCWKTVQNPYNLRIGGADIGATHPLTVQACGNVNGICSQVTVP